MMRFCRLVMLLGVATVIGSGTLYAQPSTAAASTDKFFLEVTGGPTFGNTTSGSVGAEGRYRMNDRFGEFAEVGVMNNVATVSIADKASRIAGTLGATASAKQRAVYGAGGITMEFPRMNRFTPYGLLGVGAATVSNKTKFFVGGTDITGELAQRGVQLGVDLAGSYTKVFVTAGVGAHVPVMGRWIGDISYRYGNISRDVSSESSRINTNRLQFGIGTRF